MSSKHWIETAIKKPASFKTQAQRAARARRNSPAITRTRR